MFFANIDAIHTQTKTERAPPLRNAFRGIKNETG